MITATEIPLDLLSISQTDFQRCPYGAPLVALIVAGQGRIQRACCNHWDCPCCGIIRAKQEYRRIVHGCEVLALDHDLYFWTLTCRGREITLQEAEERYLEWTNTLLTNARTKAGRAHVFWSYSQVTERQHKTRLHPHSHIISTFLPADAVLSKDERGRPVYVSEWFARANFTAGLGNQHKITKVENAAAVSRYIAKYLFKDTALEQWPAHWRRVRYSRNFPALPLFTPDFVVALLSPSDWRAAEEKNVRYSCASLGLLDIARHHIANVVYAPESSQVG